jgi:predicted dehydrogenase
VCDAVIVATPNHLHEPHVLSALRAGVHVLCERPLALRRAASSACSRRRRRRGARRAGARLSSATTTASAPTCRRSPASSAPASWGASRPCARARTRRARRRGGASGAPSRAAGAFLEHGFNLLDLALWLSDAPPPTRVSAQMRRGRGANAVEDSMLVALECGDVSVALDVAWDYVGEAERTWFEVLGTAGSARLGPLRVTKQLNGRAVDVSPGGAAARESAFLQSYRAELAHFVAGGARRGAVRAAHRPARGDPRPRGGLPLGRGPARRGPVRAARAGRAARALRVGTAALALAAGAGRASAQGIEPPPISIPQPAPARARPQRST